MKTWTVLIACLTRVVTAHGPICGSTSSKPYKSFASRRPRSCTQYSIRTSGRCVRSLSKRVFDRLRTQRRDVLIEYWVQERGLRDANDLYGLLLVDPQMGPCAVTTRVRQAISTVQVFIHRIVMALEP